jgi:hypothetical protein
MSLRTEAIRQSGPLRRESVSIPGNRSATEIQGTAARVADHLDDIRIEEFLGRLQGVGCRGHRGIRIRLQGKCHLIDQGGIQQGLVALDIDHDLVAVPAQLLRHLSNSVGAAGMVRSRQNNFVVRRTHGSGDPLIVGRHADAAGCERIAASTTRTIIGLPPISASGFPGSRVDE